jgi:hypothetical protein
METYCAQRFGIFSDVDTPKGKWEPNDWHCINVIATGIAEDIDNAAIYISSSLAHSIYKVTNKGRSKLAGREFGSNIRNPHGIIFDPKQEVLFVADTGNNDIKKVDLHGTVSRVITNNKYNTRNERVDLRKPMYLAFTKYMRLLITDSSHHKIKILDTKTGTLNTLAGSGERGFLDGDATCATFNKPIGIAVAKDGNIFVCDSKNNRIRKISLDGKVSSLRQYKIMDDLTCMPLVYNFHLPWNLVIIDDILILTERSCKQLIVCKTDWNLDMLLCNVSYSSVSNLEVLKKCHLLSLSANGSIVSSIYCTDCIVRLRVSNEHNMSKESEEEHLS